MVIGDYAYSNGVEVRGQSMGDDGSMVDCGGGGSIAVAGSVRDFA